MAFYSSLMCLQLLLGFVEDLVPLCLGTLSIFICNKKFLGKLKISTSEFVCLFGFRRVWVLALHRFYLLICPKPLSHDIPHREEIQSELIHQRSIKKCLVIVLVMYLGLVNCVF
jgi:hypothetical protein